MIFDAHTRIFLPQLVITGIGPHPVIQPVVVVDQDAASSDDSQFVGFHEHRPEQVHDMANKRVLLDTIKMGVRVGTTHHGLL